MGNPVQDEYAAREEDRLSGDILIVDDTPANLKALSKLLSDAGYSVRVATSGALGLRSVELALPDLILLDVKMPEMDGYTVCRLLKAEERSRGIPVIFLSALDSVEDKVLAFQAGGVDYITKPFHVGEVLARVRTQLELRRAYEDRLKVEAYVNYVQKMESLGRMAGAIAHTFNNIHQGILGYAELCELRLPQDSPVLPMILKIVSACRRAVDITRQILTFAGHAPTATGHVDITQLLQNMAPLLEAQIPRNIGISLQLSGDLPAVPVDSDQLRQVIISLMLNATEAIGKQGGKITLSTKLVQADRGFLSEPHLPTNLPEGPYVVLEVSDTGCGMDEETRASIFEPFFTTKFPGRGLGLSVVLGIVRRHQGMVKARSVPGSGTAVTIAFPAAENSS
jgi:signal transduction histidine kinase